MYMAHHEMDRLGLPVHPAFAETQDERRTGRDLYEGKKALVHADSNLVKDSKKFLLQWKNELPANYVRRTKMAVFDPYVKKIVNARQGIMYGKPPSREVSQKLEYLLTNCDRKSTTADVFFELVAKDGQIDGAHWVLVDMPLSDPDNPPTTLNDEIQSGNRVFFQKVAASLVINWQVGDDLKLDWAVVLQGREKGIRTPFEDPEVIPQAKVWTRKEWVLFEPGGDIGDGKLKEVGRGINHAGEVPLIPFLGERVTDYSGFPITNDIFSIILSLYNKKSLRDWFEYLIGNPIPYSISKNPIVDMMDTTGGFWVEAADGLSTEVGYMEVTGAAAGMLDKTIVSYQAQIENFALSQGKKDSAQIESADGQLQRSKGLTQNLKNSSQYYEDQETKCWDMAGAWIGDSGENDIKYNRDFDDALVDDRMLAAIFDAQSRGYITKKTVLGAMDAAEIVDFDGTIEQELAAAAKESSGAVANQAVEVMTRLRSVSGDTPPDAV